VELKVWAALRLLRVVTKYWVLSVMSLLCSPGFVVMISERMMAWRMLEAEQMGLLLTLLRVGLLAERLQFYGGNWIV
jgi:hypothetical protein